MLIILAEIVAASHSVLEQRYVRKYNIHPLLAVGLEGLFGIIMIGTMLYPLYRIQTNLALSEDPEGRLENGLDALAMIKQSWEIRTGLIGKVLLKKLDLMLMTGEPCESNREPM